MFKGANLGAHLVLVLFLTFNLIGITGFAAEQDSSDSINTIPEIDRRNYEKVETATFALGCFWGGEALFGAQSGVIRTRVGYAGGTTENPTYRNIGDHTESIQVDYNPEEITFEELAKIFWDNHDPEAGSYKQQYDKILFYHDEEQSQIAESSKESISESANGNINTRITELKNFYPGEDYHQKYRLKQNVKFIGELREIYPDPEELRDSTAAARLNGYLAGYGSSKSVSSNLGKLGLSEDTRAELKERFDINESSAS